MKKRELTPLAIECKKKMIELGMTQVELAEKLGVKFQYLDLIFHGKRSGAKYINQIIELLGLDPEEIQKKIA